MSEKLKIAICISGFIRTWEHTKESFQNVLCKDKNVEFDLFLHVYEQNLFEWSSGENNISYTEEQIKEMFSGLNVKKLVIEKFDENHTEKIMSKCRNYERLPYFQHPMKHSGDENAKTLPVGYRIYDQLRKIYKANRLRQIYEFENNIKYNLVIKTRFDVLYFDAIFPYNRFLGKSQKLLNFEYNFIRFLDGKCHLSFGCTLGWPDDLAAIGTPEVMDIYQDRYRLVDKLLFELGGQTTGLCPHATIIQSLKYKNKEYVSDFIQVGVLRAKNKICKPYDGAVVEVSDEEIKNPNLFGLHDSYLFKQRTGQL